VPLVTQFIKSVELFPSPNNGDFMVSGIFAAIVQHVSISIYDAVGEAIFESCPILQSGVLNQKITLPGVAPGAYFMKLQAGNDIKSTQFIVR